MKKTAVKLLTLLACAAGLGLCAYAAPPGSGWLPVPPPAPDDEPAVSVCAAQVPALAYGLLVLHFGGEDDRIRIDDDVIKQLPGVPNPVNKRQHFEVLEIWGYIGKGQYRMRFFLFPVADQPCIVMGQEILEFADL